MTDSTAPAENGAPARSVVHILAALAAVATVVAIPASADAQYFGRNKVMYHDFDFRVLETTHFDIYHYGDDMDRTVRDLGQMSERWYERLARTLQHEFERRKPIIAYHNTPDFQQTNAIPGFISQATGGVTESVKNRVILPFAGSYGETDHVLGHELVHAFQYDLAQAGTGGGQTAIARAPLWVVEGMAEYLSVGRRDPHTAMWMRDAVLRDSLPTIDQLSNPQEYFPYRFGQAFWAYAAGSRGDDVVGDLYRAIGDRGLRGAIELVLALHPDTVSAQWQRDTRAYYAPTLEGRTLPSEVGDVLLEPGDDGGGLNLSPEVSPDGSQVVLLSQQDPFSIDLFLVDAASGQVLGELASSRRNPHFEALAFTNTSGTWSPDGSSFAFVTFAKGDNQIAIADVEDRSVTRTIAIPEVGAIMGLAWSPDGGSIAFSGLRGGVNDLFVLDLETGDARELTNDRFMERHPAWSPDGSRIAFATDRGPAADLDVLHFPRSNLAIMDVESAEIDVVDVFDGKHIDPEFSPDGGSLYFISDREGFSDIYRYDLASGSARQVTRAATGISGLTARSPAMSLADEAGDLVFTVFSSGEYLLSHIDDPEDVEQPVRGTPGRPPAAYLPPMETLGDPMLVAQYLDDPRTGLPPTEGWTARDYDGNLQLDYIAQPSAGVSVDRFGTSLGGSVAAYFSDMLGNRQLGVGLSANGSFQDIGAQAIYVDRGDRANWGLRGGRIPYRSASVRVGTGDLDGTTFRTVDLLIRRTILYRASAMLEYPLSTTERWEFEAGGTRYDFDREIQRDFISAGGAVVDQTEIELSDPPSLNLGTASAAFVRDNSQFGFTSPVAGQRMRLELEGNVGSLDFANALADVRDYSFFEPLTFAVRGLHFGRYGPDAEDGRLSPLFLGQGTFVRGYSLQSFDGSECTDVPGRPEACPEFDRLIGSRIVVANAALRVPLLGTEQFGLIPWGFLPTELSLFTDAGVAWTSEESPELELTERSTERIPVFSSGASLRFNLFGRMVMELYYAVPFQRPGKDGVWGFQVAPGW